MKARQKLTGRCGEDFEIVIRCVKGQEDRVQFRSPPRRVMYSIGGLGARNVSSWTWLIGAIMDVRVPKGHGSDAIIIIF